MLSVSQRWPHQVQACKVSLSVNILGLCSSKCISLLKFPSTPQGRTERVCWVTTWWMLRLCCRVSLWMSKKVTMCWTCVPLQEGKPWLCFSPTPSVRVFVPFVSFHCTSVSPLILSSAFFLFEPKVFCAWMIPLCRERCGWNESSTATSTSSSCPMKSYASPPLMAPSGGKLRGTLLTE